MKLLFIISLLILFSCSEDSKKHKPTEPVITRKMAMDNVPNEKTTYDTIYTINMADNEDLLQSLKSQLKIDEFSIEERENRGGFSYTNCNENYEVLIRGNGIRDYFIRSKKPNKGTKDYYPDFVMLVYEFPTKELALQNYNLILKTRKSKGWRLCNGITVDKIVLNGNEVFHLSTRAEMFRTEIEKYGELIENYKIDQSK